MNKFVTALFMLLIIGIFLEQIFLTWALYDLTDTLNNKDVCTVCNCPDSMKGLMKK